MKVSGFVLNTATVHFAGGTLKDEGMKALDRGLTSIPTASVSSLRRSRNFSYTAKRIALKDFVIILIQSFLIKI